MTLRPTNTEVLGNYPPTPPDLLHQPINVSGSESAEAIVARNDSSERENVIPYNLGAET